MRCGKNEIKNRVRCACLANEGVTKVVVLSSFLSRHTSITKLIPSNVKNEIPMGKGILSRKCPTELSAENSVCEIRGLYLKKANPARFKTIPETAISFLFF